MLILTVRRAGYECETQSFILPILPTAGRRGAPIGYAGKIMGNILASSAHGGGGRDCHWLTRARSVRFSVIPLAEMPFYIREHSHLRRLRRNERAGSPHCCGRDSR